MDQLLSDLSQALGGRIYLPDDDKYNESRNSYFSAQERGIKPACVLLPQTSGEVATAVSLLAEANKRAGIGSFKFAVRSGGHACFAGSANTAGGITIDLRGLSSVNVAEDSTTVTAGSGVSWGELYRTLEPLGLAVAGGRHSQVGVGGLTLGGGMSHFSGQVGLVCDTVLEYEVVLPSGDVIRITEADIEHADLFRALRGGSNNFGIVTRFIFRAFRQGRLWAGMLLHPLETRTEQLQAFYDFCATPSYDPHASLMQTFGLSAERGTGCVNSIVYTKAETEPAVYKPFTAMQPVYMNTLRELSLLELTREQDALNENGLCQVMISTTYYLDLPLLTRTVDLYQASCDSVRNYAGIVWSLTFHPIVPSTISKSTFLQSAIPTLSSPPKPIIIAQITGTWKDGKDTAAVEVTAVQLISDIDAAAKEEGLQTGYVYLNYAHSGQKVFGEGERLQQLRDVSKRYDPDGIFQHCVPGGFKLF
ncbi:putative oxidoreductase [Lentithecium fluviatile CBS 122367]|uniref:Putative oxidoreductase n=1 Tax=Lentithecium fluviatile CBS 122367 TaxID=1168545 RepID=A0A6G1IDI4_9PLEO|nr:putative oxidoreductase [Lentithecium fluviatile CBS 122367]